MGGFPYSRSRPLNLHLASSRLLRLPLRFGGEVYHCKVFKFTPTKSIIGTLFLISNLSAPSLHPRLACRLQGDIIKETVPSVARSLTSIPAYLSPPIVSSGGQFPLSLNSQSDGRTTFKFNMCIGVVWRLSFRRLLN